MSNEVTKRADNYAARYEVTNPYAAFAAEGGPSLASFSSAKKAIGRSGATATMFLPRLASSSSSIR